MDRARVPTLRQLAFVTMIAFLPLPTAGYASPMDDVPTGQNVATDPATSAMLAALVAVEREWSHISFELTDRDTRIQAMAALAEQAGQLASRYPGHAEPLIWQALALSSQAGLKGGMGALSLAREARALLEMAGRLDYHAVGGAVPTSLGSLYYKVPGFPLSFGDDDKARRYLEEGLAINPDGLDANYFYGDFLFQRGDYRKAAEVLAHGLAAPPIQDRPVWDAGRRAEIRVLLRHAQQKLAAG
ncbi:tetratricopeptide repeat protein [Nitrospirillum sp. BR 11163]|uniref:tetratricopeptide repeat protein n=1 Tax=Nitrospirillum sp. BR 11163 TaxID=3104323 RepID=UPI002AFF357C|nr:tetratricopeptide repeat protein [Nitrospirillum sp. BR 11163]MEA1672902.1 hypothetical protein [Nitrospirillum sp. BR 11163]